MRGLLLNTALKFPCPLEFYSKESYAPSHKDNNLQNKTFLEQITQNSKSDSILTHVHFCLFVNYYGQTFMRYRRV